MNADVRRWALECPEQSRRTLDYAVGISVGGQEWRKGVIIGGGITCYNEPWTQSM